MVVLLAAGSGSCPSCAAHPGIKKGRVHAKAVLAWPLSQHPCYLLLVLKLANCSLFVLLGTELVTWFALCLGRSNTHTECQVVCFIFVPLPLSPTATARRLCLYACLLESTEARPFELKRTQSQKDGSSTSWIEPSLCINQPVLTFV